jgi:transposase
MEMKREDIEKIYDQGKDAVVDFIIQLLERIVTLTARVEELEKKLNKDSHNSSKPPSTDGFKKIKKTRSQRKRTGKKSGGQNGHPGNTLEMVAKPDHIVKIKVKTCKCCGKSIKNASAKSYEARQEFEIPAPVVEVTEYQADITDCPHCGVENRAVFPEGITHKTQYGNYLRSIAVYFRNYQLIPLERTAEIFSDLFNVPLSEGTIIAASARCGEALNGFSEWNIKRIMESHVVNFDETGVNIGGSLHWIHTAGTPLLTTYFVHKRRGSEAIDALNILPGFSGKAVHDHWPVYFKYSCKHALCNAHHIRELIFAFEQEGQIWAQKMIDCLLEIKESVEKAGEKGKLITSSLMRKYEKKYKDILRLGFRKNPIEKSDTIKKRGRPKKTKTQNLLFRLRDYQNETLAFMYDLDVPFDNNLAERDIRMIKVQQKISGLFRTMTGAEQFCKIRSFISTVKKQEFNVIESIYQIMIGKQIYLDFQS